MSDNESGKTLVDVLYDMAEACRFEDQHNWTMYAPPSTIDTWREKYAPVQRDYNPEKPVHFGGIPIMLDETMPADTWRVVNGNGLLLYQGQA